MRLPLGRTASAAALLLLVSLPARAQDPVTLPEMKILAKMDKPGARILVGIVVDTGGNPIAGAEVTVPDLPRRIFTGPDGTFRLDSVRTGEFTMRARKIGYAAQVRKFEIDSAGGVAAFALLPITTTLPSMVSSATRRGLSGYVGDLGMNPVEGATVRVLGASLNAKTDVAGNFFLPAETGRYMVSITKDSFLTKLVSVSIPSDSGRHVNAWLMPGKIPKDEYWNVDDLRERQAWVRPKDRVLYTREDLARLKIEWVYDAVALTAQQFQFPDQFSRDCMVVADGGPEIVNLAMLTIDDVESVEIYRSYPPPLPTVGAAAPQGKSATIKGGQFVWFNNARRAIIENGARICPAVYVWLR